MCDQENTDMLRHMLGRLICLFDKTELTANTLCATKMVAVFIDTVRSKF